MIEIYYLSGQHINDTRLFDACRRLNCPIRIYAMAEQDVPIRLRNLDGVEIVHYNLGEEPDIEDRIDSINHGNGDSLDELRQEIKVSER